jgi:arabinogalactan oligomer/maltooligosaccharide transport system permease protein
MIVKSGLRGRIFRQLTKIILLALATAGLTFMAYVAFLGNQMIIGFTLVAIAVLANVVFLNRRVVAPKFLLPGAILMVIFVILPIFYTVGMSFFHYGTGNEVSKADAITSLEAAGLVQAESGETYTMVLGDYKGRTAALLTDQASGIVSLATSSSISTLIPGTFTSVGGVAKKYPGLRTWTVSEKAASDGLIRKLEFRVDKKRMIVPQDSESAAMMEQSYIINSSETSLTDTLAGKTYYDNGNGNFVAKSGEVLYPGWQAFNPGLNYSSLIFDPRLSKPFFNVFLWTVVFAFSTVGIMFFAGLGLAIALDKKIRFRNFYRAILILPYAVPSFMSILIWNGMFNRQFGAVNLLLGQHIDWYNSPILAKVVILVVNLWLGFPYFYLISSGALQALPTDVIEAAEIDGASGGQIFRQIKLPMLMQILAPLLIASFAFNFNNFNIVYLLTGGGPTDVLHGATAGATDILITYAYKTAFGSETQNLGLASAISVIMFLIVGALSMWSLKRSKVLQEI